jgi:hypothetical protein
MRLPSLEIAAIAELAHTPAWVCWRAQVRNGKPTKVPYTPAGSLASSTDPRTWSSYAECWKAAYFAGDHDGIGRVLTGDGIIGIDLDDRLDLLPGIVSYTERSPSGNGLHIWVRGSWPVDGTKRKSIGIEVSYRRFYLTITGNHVAGTPEDIRHVDLAPLWEQLRPRQGNGSGGAPRACDDALRQQLDLPLEAPDPIDPSDVDQIARKCPQLRRILAGNYQSRSERDLALCRFAKLAGRPAVDAWRLMLAVRTDGRASKAERTSYAVLTIARIYAT